MISSGPSSSRMTCYTLLVLVPSGIEVSSSTSEEKMNEFHIKYYSLSCKYRGFNGTVFGETAIEIQIQKFNGVRWIETLAAFPFPYHPRQYAVKAELVECGRRFITLMGSHHCYC